ncbi:MAG: hypothetical protein R3F59_23325 [Myxococcota bacterium]
MLALLPACARHGGRASDTVSETGGGTETGTGTGIVLAAAARGRAGAGWRRQRGRCGRRRRLERPPVHGRAAGRRRRVGTVSDGGDPGVGPADGLVDYFRWPADGAFDYPARLAGRADDLALAQRLADVDAVFLKGGDQGVYYDLWNDRAIEVDPADPRSAAGVGGTSAGRCRWRRRAGGRRPGQC